MKVNTCRLKGILLIEPKIFSDERGFFLENFACGRYKNIGITENFVQDNHSRSKKNVLRGMHFTKKNQQAQLVTIMRGSVFDVVVDIREGSDTFGQWFGVELSENGIRQIYMPHGFAHGFCVLSDWADLNYKVSSVYESSDEGGILWNDQTIGIKWPIKNPIVNSKDISLPRFSELKFT